jgi:hypothetical protein
MTTEQQLAANRQNAQLSTGPKTPRGKDASRLNALKHGILARETVINRDDHHEDADQFESLSDQLCEDLAPVGYLEELLVEQITIAYWRLRRAVRADTIEFGKILRRQAEAASSPITIGGSTYPRELPSLPEDGTLSTLNRYEKSIQNDLYGAMTQLDKIQARRSSSRPGRPGSSSASAHSHSRNAMILKSLLARVAAQGQQSAPARDTSPPQTSQDPAPNPCVDPPSTSQGNGIITTGSHEPDARTPKAKTNNEKRTTKNELPQNA